MKKAIQGHLYINQKSQHRITISTFIKADSTTVFKAMTDIKLLELFFPIYNFSSDSKRLNKVGQEYVAQIGNFIKERYKILILEKDSILSATLVSRSTIFKNFTYIHKLLPVKDGVISEETIKYRLKFGILGRILNFFIIAPILKYYVKKAHKKLKDYCE